MNFWGLQYASSDDQRSISANGRCWAHVARLQRLQREQGRYVHHRRALRPFGKPSTKHAVSWSTPAASAIGGNCVERGGARSYSDDWATCSSMARRLGSSRGGVRRCLRTRAESHTRAAQCDEGGLRAGSGHRELLTPSCAAPTPGICSMGRGRAGTTSRRGTRHRTTWSYGPRHEPVLLPGGSGGLRPRGDQ